MQPIYIRGVGGGRKEGPDPFYLNVLLSPGRGLHPARGRWLWQVGPCEWRPASGLHCSPRRQLSLPKSRQGRFQPDFEGELGAHTWQKDILFFPFLKKKGVEWIVHPTGLRQRDAWTKGLSCDTGLLSVCWCTVWRPAADIQYFFCIKYFYMCLYCSIWMDNNSSCLSKISKSNKKLLTGLDYVLFFMAFSTLLSRRVAASLGPMSSLWSIS